MISEKSIFSNVLPRDPKIGQSVAKNGPQKTLAADFWFSPFLPFLGQKSPKTPFFFRKSKKKSATNVFFFKGIFCHTFTQFGVSRSKIGEDRFLVIFQKSRLKLRISIETPIFSKFQTSISRQRKKIFEFRKKHLDPCLEQFYFSITSKNDPKIS